MRKIVVNKNTPYIGETFGHLGEVTGLETREVSADNVRDADMLIVRSETNVGGKLLDGSRVGFVGTVTIGTDHVDLDYLRSRNISFASAPGSNSHSVAEYMAAALLMLAMRENYTLEGKTIGVVGVGNVGSKVVKVAEAFGMRVLQNDPPRRRDSGDPVFLPLDELMDADIITLHVPLTTEGTDKTHHLFDEKRISRMKRGAVLINTARGPVVQTNALKQAISNGRLSTAILDVWENEPAIDTELLSRVYIGTPHIAGYSLDGKINAVQMVYEAACRYLSEPMKHNARGFLPPADGSPVIFSGRGISREEILYDIVSQCYDIKTDDLRLRQSLSIPPSQQGQYFMRLRAEYRVRREFNNRTVVVHPVIGPLEGMLKALRFKTVQASPKPHE